MRFGPIVLLVVVTMTVSCTKVSSQHTSGKKFPSSTRRKGQSARTFSTGKLDHLRDCDRIQSEKSLKQLAVEYGPSKFTFSHSNYQRFYPRWLEEYRWKRFKMLEIGIDTGKGSLLWKEYFPCVELYGLDTKASTVDTEGGQLIHMIVGDQGDPKFLSQNLMEETGGGFHVIIDDGGHHYEQQVASYLTLFDEALVPGGLYIIEDIETSYWEKGSKLYSQRITRGGCKEEYNTMQNLKKVIDVVNKKFIDNDLVAMGEVDHWVASITFGSNVVILEKKDESHCIAEVAYTWPGRLSNDCRARNQKYVHNKVTEFCSRST